MKYWKFVWVGLFVFLAQSSFSQHSYQNLSAEKYDSLLNYYSENKCFDSTMLVPTLLALQFYPELKEVNIEFIRKDIPTLMAARPKIWSVFRKKEFRKYYIIISTNPDNHTRELFQNMSLKSKTGILGHEFAHLIDYESRSGMGILWFGICYLINKKGIERKTDRVAIERGLGNEMLEYTMHIKHSKLASKKYLARKKKYYLSVAEINDLVSNRF